MNDSMTKMHELVVKLNRYCDEYYNQHSPSVSDAAYDRLYDELETLEKQTGIQLSNSPTRRVGYPIVSGLKEVHHDIALLSLDKTKSINDLVKFQRNHTVNLSPKLDGLTIKLVYENGELQSASTRGDGNVGEDITHNVGAISGIPQRIPYQNHLVVTGEAFIHKSDFERLKEILVDSKGKKFKNGRNLAAGSVTAHNAATCAKRCVNFLPFAVINGLDDEKLAIPNSKRAKTLKLCEYGFGKLKTVQINLGDYNLLESTVDLLTKKADEDDLPIDGIVICYDDINYSKSCGRTGKYYKDGLAFKFEDDNHETVLRNIEWITSRTGEITPVAEFDTIVIDGCDVSRATLHNVSCVEELELMVGNRILVSKRHMIIPHVEDNLDRGGFDIEKVVPKTCSWCGQPTRIHISDGSKMLFCDNVDCGLRNIRQIAHFVSKKALDIEGISENTIERFMAMGFLKERMDIFSLDRFRNEIILLDGYGEISWNKLWDAIQNARNTTFERFVIAADIPMIGNHASRELAKVFSNSLDEFEAAAIGKYDFTTLSDFGEILNNNIHSWFSDQNNLKLWRDMKAMMTIKTQSQTPVVTNSPFAGKTIVVTGKVEPYTRDGIHQKIYLLGGKPSGSVTKNTDYLICGDNAGSKLDKANALGVKVLTPAEFFKMAGEIS